MLARFIQRARESVRRLLAVADAALNRLYTWRYNPLYQSGTLVVVSFLLMLISGIYLLFFYRIGSPWESIARIEEQVWAGRWLRAIHRYAADLAVVAAALHALRMFAQGRSWGPRALAWVSGWLLLFGTFICGWTGYVMVWDGQAQILALEGARLLDALPIFSEPIGRTFVGEQALPNAFFFLNLFLHVALPVGAAMALWIHVARVARPVLLPPRGLLVGTTVVLLAASLLVPAPLGPKADLTRLLGSVPIDVFYGFWIPASRALQPGMVWLLFVGFAGGLCLAPLWSRPPREKRRGPSASPGRLCTGCDQCTVDCPYEAIAMLNLPGLDLGHPVAHVDPALCVSCGICTASCAPMAVGPLGENGRDELRRVSRFLEEHRFGPTDVVVVACERGEGRLAGEAWVPEDGAAVYPVRCIGHLHTSVIEYLLRSGVGGVLVGSCPPRDCWSREGPIWLVERLYAGREAELRESIDRRRIEVVYAAEAERSTVQDALRAFRTQVEELDRADREETIEIATDCEPKQAEAIS